MGTSNFDQGLLVVTGGLKANGHIENGQFRSKHFCQNLSFFIICQNFEGTLEMKKNKIDICYAFSNLQFRF